MKGLVLTAFIAILLLASTAAGQKLEPPKLVPTPSTESQWSPTFSPGPGVTAGRRWIESRRQILSR